MENNKYLISETTKSERIALIKSWIPEDEVMDGCDIDLWDMYADYINGTKEIAECNAAFQAEYYTDLQDKKEVYLSFIMDFARQND